MIIEQTLAPNLFIVGFQKCGSSTLFDLLVKHPDISGTTPKETFFLTDRDYDNFDYERNIKNTSASWSSFIRESPSKYLLEGSVCNFYQETALRYISKKRDSKVIFIIRDPTKRFVSNYTYYYGKVNGINAGVTMRRYVELLKSDYYNRQSLKYALQHGCYSRYINKWKEALGSERVHVLSLEQLTRDTEQTVAKLFGFLDLPSLANVMLPWQNRSIVYNRPGLHKLLVGLFRNSFLARGPIRRLYNRLFASNAVLRLDAEVLEDLQSYYKEEYRNFKEFF